MTLTQIKEHIPFDKPRPLIVAAIPAFNEERTIAKLVLEAKKHVDVVLVCDDGSSDMTAKIAEKLGADVIRHEKNMGYGAAIKTLFTIARQINADILVTLDGDGQHDPSHIPIVLKPVLQNEVDVVIGSRFLETGKENGVPKYRQLGIKLITKLTAAASNHSFSDAQSGFRVYSRKAIEGLNLFENGMGVSVEALLEAKKQGFKVAEVPTKIYYEGLEKTSKTGPIEQGTSVIMSIIRLVVEDMPLQLLGIPGVISLWMGLLFGVWMLRILTLEHHIETNIALASIAFVLIGMFSIFTSITLYAIARNTEKNGNNGH